MKETNPASTSKKPTKVAVKKVKGPAPASQPSRVSEEASLFQKAVERVTSSPSSSREKVNALKRKVKEGTYRPDAREVAEKLVEEHLKLDFGKNNL